MLWLLAVLSDVPASGPPLLFGMTIQQLVSSIVVGAIVAGVFTLAQTLLTKKLTTPADRIAAEAAANDLIIRLLDRANGEIARYEALIEKLSQDVALKGAAAEIAGEMRESLERVTQERDRLLIAITFLREKAQRTGHLTYAEIVVWARNALDPSVDLGVFNVDLEDDIEDTIIPAP